MINRDEIDEVAATLGVHTTDVQRDYVFGWVLAALYGETALAKLLHLKGGNCLRKVYLPDSRFSSDLDFGAEGSLDPALVNDALGRVCDVASAGAGVTFLKDQTRLEEKRRVQADLSVYEARLYFRDFYGQASKIHISIRLDMTEFDRLHLGAIDRPLIHAYSDADACQATLRCVRLEEVLASKLKCLLQRRHVADLYDLVHWIVFSKEPIDRADVARVFLRKTIYQPAPGVAADLLRALPFDVLAKLWDRFIVCAENVLVAFDEAVERFLGLVGELFAGASSHSRLSFFPAELRNPILEAGSKTALLRLTYDGAERVVEPYSLRFKRRDDGGGGEYLYAYNREGGSSPPGVRSFVAEKIQSVEVTGEKFEPRFEIELAKAGEPTGRQHFSRGGRASGVRTSLPSVLRPRSTRQRTASTFRPPQYHFKCSVCGKTFARKEYDATIREHKGRNHLPCIGRIGIYQGYR